MTEEIHVGPGYIREGDQVPVIFEDIGDFSTWLRGDRVRQRNRGWRSGFVAGLVCTAALVAVVLILLEMLR